VRRDIDVLSELAECGAVMVNLSITTLDPELHRVLEPRTSSPAMRLEAVRALSSAGIPVGVNVAPVIPGLNCHEIPSILEAAAMAGARTAGHIVLRLPHGVKSLFEAWLQTHRPERAGKVLSRLRSMRGGELNDSRFGARMQGEGVFAQQIHDLFEVSLQRAGLSRERTTPSADFFRRPPAPQLELFG
jgi:DNA repair photolyase